MAAATSERSTAEVLRAARERISDPERWLQGWFAKTDLGTICEATHSMAKCWCASGSLLAELSLNGGEESLEGTEAYRFLTEAAEEFDRGSTPAGINDDVGHAAVLRMYSRAIELAEASA